MAGAFNSRETRVRPTFGWLRDHGGVRWPQDLLALAGDDANPGACLAVQLDPEHRVQPSPARLLWMLKHIDLLTATGQANASRLAARAADRQAIEAALSAADTDPPTDLVLEGPTSADCVITCEQMIIWIEGKRTDKLARGTSYDGKRDQVARNLEAAWLTASSANQDFRVVISSEEPLSGYEAELVAGYRSGRFDTGLPHLAEDLRAAFASRLLTCRWIDIANRWPALRALPALRDLASPEN